MWSSEDDEESQIQEAITRSVSKDRRQQIDDMGSSEEDEQSQIEEAIRRSLSLDRRQRVADCRRETENNLGSITFSTEDEDSQVQEAIRRSLSSNERLQTEDFKRTTKNDIVPAALPAEGENSQIQEAIIRSLSLDRRQPVEDCRRMMENDIEPTTFSTVEKNFRSGEATGHYMVMNRRQEINESAERMETTEYVSILSLDPSYSEYTELSEHNDNYSLDTTAIFSSILPEEQTQDDDDDCLRASTKIVDETNAFCRMVADIRRQSSMKDPTTNRGYIVSAKRKLKDPTKRFLYGDNMTVKVMITSHLLHNPYNFTPEINIRVADVIQIVLMSVSKKATADGYVLRVFGLSEYLLNNSVLCDYEYVQNCLNLGKDSHFVLVELRSLRRSFLRMSNEDWESVYIPKSAVVNYPHGKIQGDTLLAVVNRCYNEIENLTKQVANSSQGKIIGSADVVQSLKEVCTIMQMISSDLLKVMQSLERITVNEVRDSPKRDSRSSVSSLLRSGDLSPALGDLTQAFKAMIDLHCQLFQLDLGVPRLLHVRRGKFHLSTEEVVPVLIHVDSVHKLEGNWAGKYADFKVKCGLFYGGLNLAAEQETRARPTTTKYAENTIVIDEWRSFDSIMISSLPRETRLCFTVFGISSSENSKKSDISVTPLGWVAIQLFNQRGTLVQGPQLLPLWPKNVANPISASFFQTTENSILLQVTLPEFEYDIAFPSKLDSLPPCDKNFDSLPLDDRNQLRKIIKKSPLCDLTMEERKLVWNKRHCLSSIPEGLSAVLKSAPAWSADFLPAVYSLLDHWSPLRPGEVLELLLPWFPDVHVRSFAVEYFSRLDNDDLCEYLPQLVQALKFESYHTSSLARLLLERCLSSVRFTHQLYWLLKEASDDTLFVKRFELMMGALLSIVGNKVHERLSQQENFTSLLTKMAKEVQITKEIEQKTMVLRQSLSTIQDQDFFKTGLYLPLNPSMEALGFESTSCTFFKSKTNPLKLVFRNVEPEEQSLSVIFKVGDDIRQDMFVMQLIRIMDSVWLLNGLDLRMVYFRCMPTKRGEGFIELVTESETLCAIQTRRDRGPTGVFKENTISEYLRAWNTNEFEYQRALQNFTLSCAGCCVATYILGVCDRHNDNIMIRHTGHMFHIDFAKIFGDKQKFLSFSRDRVPFIFTDVMVYAINDGARSSVNFQIFIDSCCKAFNIVRKNANLLITIFSLMSVSGIPRISGQAAKYVQDALVLDMSEIEATAYYTNLIKTGLKSIFPTINNLVHSTANMGGTRHDRSLLSFTPKVYSKETDSKLTSVELHQCQKRYSPKKHCLFVVKVERENERVPTYVYRRYADFKEFQQKLLDLAPSFSKSTLSKNKFLVRGGRRKENIDAFLRSLLATAPEISDHDLVYTFFHPTLQDEQDRDKIDLPEFGKKSNANLKKKHSLDSDSESNAPQILGAVKLLKLATTYEPIKGQFVVLVCHARELVGEEDEKSDPFVEICLQVPSREPIRKETAVVQGSKHPSFNEDFKFAVSSDCWSEGVLTVAVFDKSRHAVARKNQLLGTVEIPLTSIDTSSDYNSDDTPKITEKWYQLKSDDDSVEPVTKSTWYLE